MTAITRTATVRLDPGAAFDTFTAEMDAWYPRGPHSFNYPEHAVGIDLEPWVGGRWREVWRDGDGYEIGQVLAWEPGERVLLSYRNRYLPDDPLTEIEVRFEAVPDGTRVTLEHRGWERLPPEALREWAGRAWRGFIAAFAARAGSTDPAPPPTHGTPTRGAPMQGALREGTPMGGTPMTETTATRTSVDQQAVVPFLSYQDGPAAMDWLAKAFGFVERTRSLNDDSTLAHGEMLAGDGMIMMAGCVPGYQSPRAHREHCAAAAAWSEVPWVIDGVMVQVDDVDAHHARAVRAGARILSEPEGKPYGRSYRVEDVEGHRWMFQQRAR